MTTGTGCRIYERVTWTKSCPSGGYLLFYFSSWLANFWEISIFINHFANTHGGPKIYDLYQIHLESFIIKFSISLGNNVLPINWQ